MKIDINVEIYDRKDSELNSVNIDDPRIKLITSLCKQIEQSNEFKLVKPMINSSDYPDISFPNENLTIKVLLIGDSEFFEFFEAHNINEGESPLGMSLLTTGDGLLDETFYMREHVVAINMEESFYLKLLKEDRKLNIDPYQDKNDGDIMYSWLNTVSHELQHSKEFIEHGAGFTPHEINNLYEEGFDFDVFDVSTGYSIISDYDEGFSLDDVDSIINKMEERVESNGYITLNNCDLAKTNFNQCVEYFSEKINVKHNKSRKLKYR
jgi:hypothetical protein